MNYTTALSEWLYRELKRTIGADATVFPLATKQEVNGAYIMYDSIELLYERTKDGNYPIAVNARVLAVDKSYDSVELLADTVEAMLVDGVIPEMGDVIVASRRSDFDPSTAEFIEEIKISVDI